MKWKFLFDIFVDKGLKIRFLLLKLNIALAYDVNTFAKFLLASLFTKQLHHYLPLALINCSHFSNGYIIKNNIGILHSITSKGKQ